MALINKAAAVLVGLAGMTAASSADCSSAWSDQFALPGTRSSFGDALTWDDGNGPAVYVAGYTTTLPLGNIPFEYVSISDPITIGGAKHIGKWVGDKWQTVGPATYQEFDALNAMQYARALEVFDVDGPGPMGEILIMAGRSSTFVPGHATLMFDGTTWLRMGSGVNGGDEVYDLQVFNGELYACGNFAIADGENLAKWDVNLQDWVAVGGGISSNGSATVRAERMTVGDVDGNGSPELYICGVFGAVGNQGVVANKLCKWDGAGFSIVPGFIDSITVNAQYTGPTVLKVVDMGDGPSLLVGNIRYTGIVGPRAALARLKSGVWSTLIGNARIGTSGAYGLVFDAMMHGPAGSEQLHVCGTRMLQGISTVQPNSAIMRRTGAGTWETIAPTTGSASHGEIHWMRPVDWNLDGSGGDRLLIGVYANVRGGNLATLGDKRPSNIALINGLNVEIAHTGSDDLGLSSTTFIDDIDIDGAGPEPARLFIAASGGTPNGVALTSNVISFDGTAFTPFGSVTMLPHALRACNLPTIGTRLLAVGNDSSNGPSILMWNGASWDQVGSSPFYTDSSENTRSQYDSAVVFEFGGQQNLLVAGKYFEINGQPSLWVTRWDGTTWTAMSAGLPASSPNPNLSLYLNTSRRVELEVCNNQVFVTLDYTYFDTATSTLLPVSTGTYRWNGSSWDALANGEGITNIRCVDVGNGPEMFATGRLANLPGAAGDSYVARWDGAAWVPHGSSISFANPNATASRVTCAGGHDFGAGPELVIALDSQASTATGSVRGLARLDQGVWRQVDGAERLTAVSRMQSSAHPTWGGLYLATGSGRNVGGFESEGIARLITTCTQTCLADFNGQGGVSVQDIFDFLAAWFGGLPSADVNNQGGLSVQDIFDFLAAWFAGC